MIFLGNISKRSAELMFLRMYSQDITPLPGFELKDGELQKLALDFSAQIPDDKFTPAQLQGYLLNHRDSPAIAAAETSAWVKEEETKAEEMKARVEKVAKKREEKKDKNKKSQEVSVEILTKAVADGDIKGAELVRMAKEAAKKGGPEKKQKEALGVLAKAVAKGDMDAEKLVEMAKELVEKVEPEKSKLKQGEGKESGVKQEEVKEVEVEVQEESKEGEVKHGEAKEIEANGGVVKPAEAAPALSGTNNDTKGEKDTDTTKGEWEAVP
jgi:mitochondrial chaperone BCS1